jgi:peroxin-1
MGLSHIFNLILNVLNLMMLDIKQVRLVPGTELIVAPKPRKKPSSQQESTVVESSIVKACLRVQELNSSLLQPCEVGNFKCSIAPTTIIFISANTAKKFLLTNGQLVIVRSLERASKSNEQNGRTDGYRKEEGKLNKTMKSVVLRVVYAHVVAKGHVMLSSAVQHFIGAQTHTRMLSSLPSRTSLNRCT